MRRFPKRPRLVMGYWSHLTDGVEELETAKTTFEDDLGRFEESGGRRYPMNGDQRVVTVTRSRSSPSGRSR